MIFVPLKHSSKFWRSLDLPLINCKIELILSWSKNCISEISRTAAVSANPPNLARAETSTTSALFQINSAQLYVTVATLSIQENLKQEFKKTISGNKYRSEITTQPPKKQFGLYDSSDI